MSPIMTVVVSTPAGEIRFEDAVRLRFDAPDGSRGVLPRHEHARAVLVPGPIEVARSISGTEQISYVATEGGLVDIDPRTVRFVTRWATTAGTLEGLAAEVERRASVWTTLETEARALSHRHEMATRRALAGLERRLQH